MAFHPDRPWLAASTTSGRVPIFDLRGLGILQELVVDADGEWFVYAPGDPRFVASEDGARGACVRSGGELLAVDAWRQQLEVGSLSQLPPRQGSAPTDAAPCGDAPAPAPSRRGWLPWLLLLLGAGGGLGALRVLRTSPR